MQQGRAPARPDTSDGGLAGRTQERSEMLELVVVLDP